jgi:uncharacterized protein DUF5681
VVPAAANNGKNSGRRRGQAAAGLGAEEAVSAPANTQTNTRSRRGDADRIAATRWQKGQPSPNPSGRPKRKPITDEIVKQLDESAHGSDQTKLQAMVGRLVNLAMGGDLGAIKHIHAYVEGLPTQKVDIRGEVERLAERYGKDPDELYERTLRVIEGLKQ